MVAVQEFGATIDVRPNPLYIEGERDRILDLLIEAYKKLLKRNC